MFLHRSRNKSASGLRTQSFRIWLFRLPKFGRASHFSYFFSQKFTATWKTAVIISEITPENLICSPYPTLKSFLCIRLLFSFSFLDEKKKNFHFISYTDNFLVPLWLQKIVHFYFRWKRSAKVQKFNALAEKSQFYLQVLATRILHVTLTTFYHGWVQPKYDH